MVAAATTGCRTDEKPPEGLPLTEDTIPDRPQALVSPEAEQKVVNPKTALLYRYLPNPNVGAASERYERYRHEPCHWWMQGQPCFQGSAASLVFFATPRVKHLETFEFEFNFSNLGAHDPRARHAGDRLSQNHRYGSIQNCVGVSGST